MKAGSNEQLIDWPFPLEGVDLRRAFSRQQPNTCRDALNVRAFDPVTGRARGSMRAGIKRYFSLPAFYPSMGGVNAPNPSAIQDINLLVSTTLAGGSTTGGFAYSQGSGNGFGIANHLTGASLYSGLDAQSGYKFANSCWGNNGELYVAEVNTSTGAVRVSQVNSSGAVAWTTTGLTVATGTDRNVAGMVYSAAGTVPSTLSGYLFLALITVSNSTTPYAVGGSNCRIVRINAATGAIVDNPWKVGSSALYVFFSPNSINCLGCIGPYIGVENAITGSNLAFFVTYDSRSPADASYVGVRFYTQAATYGKAKVVSDGSTWFYVLANTSTSQVKKLGLGGAPAIGDTPNFDGLNSLCYDVSLGRIVAAMSAAPYIRAMDPNGAAVTNTASGNNEAWDDIDTDNNGTFTLWKNSQSSGDVMGLGSAYGILWGPSTLANAIHTGASVNKGSATANTSDTNPRGLRPLVMAGGTLQRFSSTGTTAIANGNSWNGAAKYIFSAQLGLNMFYADGTGWFYYQNNTDSVQPYVPTAGTLPSTPPRLVEQWRGRLVWSGFRDNPQNYIMAAQGNAFNIDPSPANITTTQAVAGTVSKFGYPGEYINCIIPYTDDTALFGDDHSIWILSGDPAAGGQFDNVSQTVGIAWGRPWALDPYGQVYFMSNRYGVYKLTPGALPVLISTQIDKLLQFIDFNANMVRMAWDIQERGLYVWIIPTDKTRTSTHYFFEDRTQAWFPFQYALPGMNPMSVLLYDSDNPNDKKVMLGCTDGYVRTISDSFFDDDGTPISWYVVLGPLSQRELEYNLLVDLQATMSQDSSISYFQVYAGNTAELALQNPVGLPGTWMPGRNKVASVMRGDIGIYVKLYGTGRASLERLTARYRSLGRIMRRI